MVEIEGENLRPATLVFSRGAAQPLGVVPGRDKQQRRGVRADP